MRKMAHVEVIEKIKPIPNADKIELAYVLGWQVVVKKEEFQVGDKVIYIEIDSRCPSGNEYFNFLDSRKYRVKTIKLRGVLSQGLIVPLTLLPYGVYNVGDDVSDILGITKIEDDYKITPTDKEAMLKIRLKSNHKKLSKKKWFKHMMKYSWFRKIAFALLIPKKKKKPNTFPSEVAKTDEERVQNMPWILKNKENFLVTEKIDGTSTTFLLRKKKLKDLVVCSRNRRIESPDVKTFYEDNVYWEAAIKYDIHSVLIDLLGRFADAEWVCIQGETINPLVQKNKYQVKETEFYIFNIIIGKKNSAPWKMSPLDIKSTLNSYPQLNSVPLLDTSFTLPDTVDELLDYATGTSVLYPTLREGCVFRNYDNSISFKAVSNEFLLKWDNK